MTGYRSILMQMALCLFLTGAAFGFTEAVTPQTGPTRTFNYVDPAMSPCGNFIAYARAATGSSYANVPMAARRMAGGGWQAKVLASYAEKAVLSPAISGGGRHAVFSVLNVSSGGAAMTPDTILLISSPTEEPAVIDVKAAFTALFGEPTSLYDPSFSACGRFLVFCAETPTESGWNYSLYRMDLTNGNIAEIYAMGMVRPNSPSASAGGGRIAFASWSQEDFGSRLAMVDMDAGRIFPLSDVLVSGFISPVVSADGRVVAYNDDATRTIAVIQVGEGKSEVVASLASPGDRGQRVGISADGRLMAYYETDEYGHKRAYLYDRTPPGSRRLISRKDTGEPATGSGNVYDLKSIGLSGDGSFCAFSLASPDIVPDADENYLGIYVSDGVGMAAPASSQGMPADALLAGGDEEEGPVRIGLPVHSVNVSTLSLVLKGTLFYMPGWGYPVRVSLTYNSSDTSWQGRFGPRWSMNYDTLCTLGPASAKVRKGTGEVLAFSLPGGASLLEPLAEEVSLSPPSGISESLTVSNTLIVRTRLKDLVRFEYSRASASEDKAWLTAIVDRNGNKIAINRSTSDPSRITSVNDPYGRQLLFYYNDQGQCTRIEPPGGGRSLEFAYGSTSGRLYRITDMVRNTAEYEYNSDGELYSIRNGTPVQYVEVDPGSPAPDLPAGIPVRRANVSYAPRTADSQDPLQGFRVHEVRENGLDPVMYEPVSGKPGQVRRTSRGQKPFIYGSNPQKKVESFTDPLGNTSLIGYENSLPSSLTTPNGDQTRIQYNASGFPIMATNPLGQASRYEYKGGTGLVTRYIPPGLTSDQSWRIEYNDSHNPIRVTSPLGRVTEMTYGTRGQLLTVRDPAGHVTTSTYDKYGNLLSVRRPGDPAAMQLTWDETGLLCTRIADPLGHTKDFVYDANDRLNRITWSSLAGTPSIVLEWDAFHQRRLSDELGNATLFEHNLFGLRTSTTSPLGQVRRHAYDADNRLVVSHDPLSRGTAREYDDSGRLTVVRHPIGESRRTYDKEGRQIAYQTPRGDVTQFSYDKNGCRIQAAPTGLAPVNFSYTVRNELASVTNARGQTISYAYNLDGEVTSRSIPGLGQDAYAYDSRGNLIAMTSAQGASNSRTYDANGRVVQMRWPKPGGGDWIADFVYDAADRLIRIAYPDGSVIDYTHDARNRTALPAALRNASLREAIPPEAAAMPLAAAWSKGGGVWRASAATDAAGNLLSLSRPNGVATQWTYDAARRVTSVLHRRGDDTFLSQALTYNADDTTASSAYSFPHVFVRPSSLAVTYSAHDRIETFGDNAPEYDGDGNCLTGPAGGFSAAYDALNRLLSMTRGGVTRSFVYDARDLLAGWTEGSATRNLHRDAAGHILFESDGEGRIVALHIRYGGWLLARGLPESGWSYYHFDRNGNTLALTNASGAVSASYQYMPFGLQRVSGVPGDSFLTYGGGHGVIDHGAGLHHMGRRAYHVDSQRFLQKDPLGYDGGDNLYAYANGNPVDFIDPQGTKSFMGFASGVLNAGVRAVGAPFYLAAKTYETYLGPHSDYAEKEREGYQTLIAAAEGRKSQAMARDPKAGAWGNRWDAAKKKLSDKISGTQDVAYSETGELAVEVGKEIAQNIVLAPITRGSQVAEVAVGTTLEYLGSDE